MKRALVAVVCAVTVVVGAVLVSEAPGEAASKGLTTGPVEMPASGAFKVFLFNPTSKPITTRLVLQAASGNVGTNVDNVTAGSGATNDASIGCGAGVCRGLPFLESTKLLMTAVYDSVAAGGKVAVVAGEFVTSS